MEGEVRGLYQAEGDILRVTKRDTFRLIAKKTGRHWCILSLDFNAQ